MNRMVATLLLVLRIAASASAAEPAPGPPRTEAPSRFLDYQTKADLRLPFEGEWYVFWGGRTLAENHHARDRGQRFAYDFVVLKDGKTHEGDGSRLEQYHAFDRPILAPGAGVVVAAVNGLEDRRPGHMVPENPEGNHVIIDHGGGEFSHLAHLRRGSVAVKVGDRVAAGDRVGSCGNSGHSSEPHLHYHLQTIAPLDSTGKSEGLPAQFRSYLANGKAIAHGEPRKGEVVRDDHPLPGP